MKTTMKPWLATSLGLAAACVIGCGDSGGPRPPTGKVHGKVTYKGSPLTKGSVTFVPIQGKGGETGQSASGNIESDGTFELTTFNTGDGAILGQHTAIVQARDEGSAPPTASDSSGKAIPGKMPLFNTGGANDYKPPKVLVPEKYTKVETSPLKYTVEKTNEPIEINLKD